MKFRFKTPQECSQHVAGLKIDIEEIQAEIVKYQKEYSEMLNCEEVAIFAEMSKNALIEIRKKANLLIKKGNKDTLLSVRDILGAAEAELAELVKCH